MRDGHSGVKPILAIGPAVLAASTTPAAINLAGFKSAEIVIPVGVGGITFSGVNKIEFVLTHSDDDVTYTPVTDADMLGVSGISAGVMKALVAAHAAAAVYNYGYIGGKANIKLQAAFAGTHGTGTPIAAMVLKGNPDLAPVA